MVYDDKRKQKDIDQAFENAINKRDVETLSNQEMIDIFKSVLKVVVPSEEKIFEIIGKAIPSKY